MLHLHNKESGTLNEAFKFDILVIEMVNLS